MNLEMLEKHYAKGLELEDIQKSIQQAYSPVKSPSFNRMRSSNVRRFRDPVAESLQRVERLRERYTVLEREWLQEESVIEKWLPAVKDRSIADFINSHYCLGFPWKKLTKIWGKYPYSPRRLVSQYLEQHPEVFSDGPE